MAAIRIEPPRRHYYIYYRDREGTQRHVSSGVPHSPEGDTPQQRAERAKENRRICLALANDRRKLLAAHSSDEVHSKYEHPWTRKDAEVLRADPRQQ